MTYVGATPTTGDFKKLDSITTSSATTFNLRQGGVAVYPQSANHCIVSLNGVIQAPIDAFTIVNDTIVFASSLASSDVINFILVLGNVNDIGTPSDDTVSTAKLQANAVTTAKITDGNITAAKIASGVVPTLRPNALPIIINGNMNVWQRGTSAVTMSDGYYNVDRFRGEENTSGSATWSRSTSVPDDTGLPYSLQVDCTGTDTSIASGEQCGIQHTIEAQNIAGLVKYGTSNAEKITIAFWCKSNQTGQHSVALRKLDNTQYCQPKTYTISSADTWEKKVLTFSALTSTGGAINQDNGDGLQIHWKLSAGSSYQGTADTWTQTNQGATAVSGDVNFLSSTDNNFYLTGVQLEIGEYTSATLPPFQHESFADNLRRCARYYCEWGGSNGSNYTVSYNCAAEANGSSAVANAGFFTPVPLRADPSINNPTMGYFDYNTSTADTSSGTVSVKGGEGHMNMVSVSFSGASNLDDARPVTVRARDTLTMDAEL